MQIPSHKNRKNKGLRVITLTASAFIIFMWGILPASAQTLEVAPTTIDTMSDTLSIDIGGAYCANMEDVPYWVAFSPDGNNWSSNCEGFTDAPFSENFADLPGIWTILNFTFSDRNTPSTGDLDCYEGNLIDCLSSDSYSGLSEEIYYQYTPPTPTTTPTSTTSQKNAVETNFAIFTALFLVMFAGTFILVNKFT